MRATTLKTILMCAAGSALSAANAAENMMSAIPNAKPGQCFARVVVPAEFRTESTTVVVREASEALKIIPAKFDWVEENRMVSEATNEIKIIPAEYKTEKQVVELSPAETIWVSGSKYSTVEASSGLLSLADANGADINSAQPGQCYEEYYEQAKYNNVTERVLVAEASESVLVVPAKYEWVEEKQMVAAASKLLEIPAVYETVQQRVKVEDAQVVWKKGRGGIEKIDNLSGDVMCLVEIPAVYKTIEKTVMKSAATTKVIKEPVRFTTNRVRKLIEPAREERTVIPARYREIIKRVRTSNGKHFWKNTEHAEMIPTLRKTGNIVCKKEIAAKTTTVNRTVVVKPASVQTVEIPARFQSRKVRRLLSEAQESRVTIPAVTKPVTRRIKVSDPKLEWRQILCETNTSKRAISGVQRALSVAGYDVGDINGELTDTTMSAVDKYQRENGLATGSLTIELLNKLGVNPG